MAQRNGTGMFPCEIMNHFPLLSLEEEGRLNDMLLRESFIERVLAAQFCWRQTARPHGPRFWTRSWHLAAWSLSLRIGQAGSMGPTS
jgi:hypothetical protein